jgi:hypothetical protein
MAENIGALILPIGADASQFNRSINDVKAAFKELSNTIASTPFNLVTDKQKLELNALQETLKILTTDVKAFGEAVKIPENSILGLKERIRQLNDEKIRLDPTTSASKIAKLTQEIDNLEEKLQNVNNLGKKVESSSVGVSAGFNKLSQSSSKARQALTSVNLIAQDLPFGFIAIQNNIPALFQSFSTLREEAKKTGVSVGSQLAAQFQGTAGAVLGLGLAFTAATAIITYAIQTYGSFGAAVDALFGKVDPLQKTLDRLNKSYEDYNKELKSNAEITAVADRSQSGLAQTVDILSKKATDLSKSEQERGKYLNQLKEIDKGYFGQLTTGAENVDKIKKATDEYTSALIANARVKAFQQQLDAIDAQIAPLEIFRDELKASGVEAENLRRTSTKLFVDPTEKVTKRLADNADQIEELYKRRTFIVDGLEQAIAGFKSLKKEGQDLSKTNFTLSIEPQDLDAAFNLDKIISNITKFGNALLDTNKSVEERKNALKELIAINPQVFSDLSLEKSSTLANKDAIESYLKSLEVLKKEKEFNARASQVNAEFLKQEQKSQEQAAKAEEDRFDTLVKLTYAQDDLGNSTDKIVKKNNSYLNQLNEIQQLNKAIIEDLTKGLKLDSVYSKALENLLNFGEYTKKTASDIVKSIKFLQEPFEGFFTTLLEEGSSSWRTFADDVIKQIRRITASLLSRALINGIAYLLNLATGGAAGIVKAGLKGVSTAALGDFLSSTPGAANFSGIQGGPMQMAGAVNLTLRGSDLVASINRTNTTINRVG